MPEPDLDKNGHFVVGESKLLNYIVIAISIAMFWGVLITRNFERDYSVNSFCLIYVGLLMPAVLTFIKFKRNRSIVIVNDNGLYYRGNMITNWDNFLNAYIAEEMPSASDSSGGLSDKFSIMVDYFEPATDKNYTYKMIMSGTQNKSEEQIISAIEYFSGKELVIDVVSI